MGTTLELPPGVLGAAMGFFPKLWAGGLFIEPNESRGENNRSPQRTKTESQDNPDKIDTKFAFMTCREKHL